jgi:hypothetical protein
MRMDEWVHLLIFLLEETLTLLLVTTVKSQIGNQKSSFASSYDIAMEDSASLKLRRAGKSKKL